MHRVAPYLVHHLAEDGDDIAVAEREYGVQVHRGSALWHEAENHLLRRVVLEERLGHLDDRLPCRPLAHSDQDHALAHWHHVAAFERCLFEGLVRVAPPDGEIAALEHGMELVNGPLQESLRMSRRPEHRVDGDALVDPAGRVPLEERVRYGWPKKLGAAEGLRQEAFEMAVLELRNRDPADQMIRELVGRHFIQPGPERLRCPQADC